MALPPNTGFSPLHSPNSPKLAEERRRGRSFRGGPCPFGGRERHTPSLIFDLDLEVLFSSRVFPQDVKSPVVLKAQWRKSKNEDLPSFPSTFPVGSNFGICSNRTYARSRPRHLCAAVVASRLSRSRGHQSG